ncbi:hypothetical protein NPIL_701591 [Nephila pilipes]|uniref:ATP synthase F1 subunit epsilon n=1 Tax=Nephila pilipes TaxID=299642 RepID=A0A8X6NSB2_NEPPI|nr:hypothetical protein NPIL_701591 [Nephila pilipes]
MFHKPDCSQLKQLLSVAGNDISEYKLRHPVALYSSLMGGGAGGAVREAGGSFGKMEAAREEEYFRRLQRRQILRLKKNINREILLSQKLIREHRDAIARLESRIAELTQIEE